MKSTEYLAWAITKDQKSYKDMALRVFDRHATAQQLNAVLGMSGEVGELIDTVKKHVFYDKPLDVENIKEEMGDVLWYAALLLHSIGSSFEEVMKMNHDKLEKRYPTGFSEQLASERRDKQ